MGISDLGSVLTIHLKDIKVTLFFRTLRVLPPFCHISVGCIMHRRVMVQMCRDSGKTKYYASKDIVLALFVVPIVAACPNDLLWSIVAGPVPMGQGGERKFV